MNHLQILSLVTNLKPITRDRLMLVEADYQDIEALPSGQVGTIVSHYPGEPTHYLIEFSDMSGYQYATAVLKADELLALHYELSVAS